MRSVRETLPRTPVLVIDDCSRDSTMQAAADAGARVMRLPQRQGRAECLRIGYRFALERGFDTVIRVDGDGRHEAADALEILQGLRTSGADIVVGSRFLRARTWEVPFVSSIGIDLLRRMLAPALGQTIHDPTSGFVGVKGRALALLANSHAAWPEAGALLSLQRDGCRIHEVACRTYPRRAGHWWTRLPMSLRYAGGVVATLCRHVLPLRNAGVRQVPDMNW